MKGTWRAGSSTNQRAQANTCNCEQILIYSYIANNIDILSPYFQSTHQDHVDIRSQIQLHSRQDHGGTTIIVNLISKGVALKAGWHHHEKERHKPKLFQMVWTRSSGQVQKVSRQLEHLDLQTWRRSWTFRSSLRFCLSTWRYDHEKVKTKCDQHVYLMLSGQRDSK